MKKLLAAAAATLMLLTACSAPAQTPASASGSGSASPSAAPSSAATSAPAKLTKLVVGLDDQFPPMGFWDDKNELVGFDIDLAKEVGARLGCEVVLTPIDWSTKELEIENGKIDLLWNGLTITDARKESMLMSPAYIANAQVALVKKDSGIKTLADLAGKTVALQDGSSADEAYAACPVAGKEKELVKAPENITLFNDLKIGRIDAVIVDKVVGDYYVSQNGEGKLEILSEQLADEEYGIAFKKGNQELADAVLTTLDAMVKDGKAAEISKKWFGEDRILFSYSK